MNSQSKAFSIILFLIWPFSALVIGLKNFDSKFGKKTLIALYTFLGFTAASVGDLEVYDSDFYENKSASFAQILGELLSLQTGKFYNSFISVVTGLVFDSHHYYFLILFAIYGFFYISSIFILKEFSYSNFNKFGLMFFFGMLLFLLIRPIHNLAFYTGGVYIIFTTVSYYKYKDKKFLFLMLLAPLFHIGLAIYLIVPVFLLLFKNKIWYYVIFVIVTFVAGKSNVVGAIQGVAESNSDTVLETQYKNYASDQGQEMLEDRYSAGAANSNIKLRSLSLLQEGIWYVFVPSGLALLFVERKKLVVTANQKTLFNLSLLFLGVANLMLNISQGERFLVLFCFMAIALFFVVYQNMNRLGIKTYFNKFLYAFVPVLFLFGVMSAYASNGMTSSEFFISNFFVQVYNYSI